jgi:LmbE family N-acetylglucosaminyl deacetylase
MATATVFYSPHQDDEALGMAGGIRQAIEAGREVYLVLISNGFPSAVLLSRYNSNFFCTACGWQHHFRYSAEQLVEARLAEFRASAAVLGACRVEEMLLDERCSSEEKFAHSIKDKILEYESGLPGASHRLVSGRKDFVVNPAHFACTRAAEQAQKEAGGRLDLQLYRVYEYRRRLWQGKGCDRVITLSDCQWEYKRKALGQYLWFNPDEGRLAYGLHSVPDLFGLILGWKGKENRYEFIDLLENPSAERLK